MARVAGCDLPGDLHNKCYGHSMCFVGLYCVLIRVLMLLMGGSAALVTDLQQNLIRAKVTAYFKE